MTSATVNGTTTRENVVRGSTWVLVKSRTCKIASRMTRTMPTNSEKRITGEPAQGHPSSRGAQILMAPASRARTHPIMLTRTYHWGRRGARVASNRAAPANPARSMIVRNARPIRPFWSPIRTQTTQTNAAAMRAPMAIHTANFQYGLRTSSSAARAGSCGCDTETPSITTDATVPSWQVGVRTPRAWRTPVDGIEKRGLGR
ncbi:MAG TPA: hypothetical protein DCR63_00590, partial [Microbacterium sp.]|nr:hypothetical protein [Microbacterium sp.]